MTRPLVLVGIVPICCVLFLAIGVHAEVGQCRFDPDRCSCKLAEDMQPSLCWDRIVGSPGKCMRRFCEAGWMCSCLHRTHVCLRETRIGTEVDPEDVNKSEANCKETTVEGVGGPEIVLGSIDLSFSRNGIENNSCTDVSIFVNGELFGNFKPPPEMDSSQYDAEYTKRTEHSLVELRPGDLVAWRFKSSSYYCFSNMAQAVVDGRSVSLTTPGSTIHYSRAYSDYWYENDFQPLYGTSEADDPVTWLEPRTNMLGDGSPIIPGTDMWEPVTDGGRDHAIGNYYWRWQLPSNA